VILWVTVSAERKSEFVMTVKTGIHLQFRFPGKNLDSRFHGNDGIGYRLIVSSVSPD